MGRINIILTDETENKVRDYIAKKYPRQTFGKISEVTENALKEFLQNHSLNET
jgi:hypothetical protein